MDFDRIILIKNKTRLEQLVEKFNSKAQARFYLEHNGGNFADYEQEHNTFYEGLLAVQKTMTKTLKTTLIEKSFLPSFLFADTDLVVVLGQDGLVANTAKYVGANPILAINPDPKRYKGVLLPFSATTFRKGLQHAFAGEKFLKKVTMAEARLNDGQTLLAFNDFYIGKSNHTSARYKISFGEQTENHSSSGLIISTGAGSTGWLSSVFNELNGLSQLFGLHDTTFTHQMKWDDEKLCFVVREPYKSLYTGSEIVAGMINRSTDLIIESQMPENGVIFSDGVLEDYLEFNSGKTVRIAASDQKASLVCC
ncbi:NAD(+)/NADH kinase [Cesiribacter andamanensis]|uniref:Inorganic polyphosphate/ATP-NAD kinase n=1 Tax=Cesiribacter andamanensis AMV16 TaxID=1279009 RepID=M7NQJ8_9BACT|nr:NAD(+)/NADH kinase [Cesiribacter andamanensis]EMR04000.1 inorganic polyphosphate/ATP-NAD kinase [Cesiribacter andamanensis AMV16]